MNVKMFQFDPFDAFGQPCVGLESLPKSLLARAAKASATEIVDFSFSRPPEVVKICTRFDEC